MSLIRPTPVEGWYYQLFNLDPTRPDYYVAVVDLARSIFIKLHYDDKIEQMNMVIKKYVEIPLKRDFVSIVNAYDNPRIAYLKRAYVRIGDSIDYQEVTKYDIKKRLEIVRQWVFDEVSRISDDIRFTRLPQMNM